MLYCVTAVNPIKNKAAPRAQYRLWTIMFYFFSFTYPETSVYLGRQLNKMWSPTFGKWTSFVNRKYAFAGKRSFVPKFFWPPPSMANLHASLYGTCKRCNFKKFHQMSDPGGSIPQLLILNSEMNLKIFLILGGPFHNFSSWTQRWKFCINIFCGVSYNIKHITSISNLHFQ